LELDDFHNYDERYWEGFRAVGVLERTDDVRDGVDNLDPAGVVLLVLITECVLGAVVPAMDVCRVTLVTRVLGGLVGVVGSLVDRVEMTDANEAELGVNFESGCGPDGIHTDLFDCPPFNGTEPA
jgi:hypothetical protein